MWFFMSQEIRRQGRKQKQQYHIAKRKQQYETDEHNPGLRQQKFVANKLLMQAKQAHCNTRKNQPVFMKTTTPEQEGRKQEHGH